MGPFCLVESRSQDAAANTGVLSVYLTTILYYHLQLVIDIERENIPCVHSPCFIVRSICYDYPVLFYIKLLHVPQPIHYKRLSAQISSQYHNYNGNKKGSISLDFFENIEI